MDTVQVYEHFGLTVSTNWLLPVAKANIGAACADVRLQRGLVTLGSEPVWQSQIGLPSSYYQSDGQHIVDFGSARFRLAQDQITVDAEINDVTLQLLLFPIWAAMLALRGRESLHGAVVERDNRGVAILGSTGSGKTTGSLLLIDQGWRLVTDDLIAFDETGRVRPGPRFMRLRDDRITGRESIPDGAGKHRFTPPHAKGPVELSAAVVHTSGVSELKRLPNIDAVEELLKTFYNVLPVDPAQTRNWFKTSLDVTRRIPIYGAPPRSLTTEQLLAIADG